jgi:hypothetical protein
MSCPRYIFALWTLQDDEHGIFATAWSRRLIREEQTFHRQIHGKHYNVVKLYRILQSEETTMKRTETKAQRDARLTAFEKDLLPVKTCRKCELYDICSQAFTFEPAVNAPCWKSKT